MSYFNSEQEDHMKFLAETPNEEECWCGWNLLGYCFGGCNESHPGKTRADFKVQEANETSPN